MVLPTCLTAKAAQARWSATGAWAAMEAPTGSEAWAATEQRTAKAASAVRGAAAQLRRVASTVSPRPGDVSPAVVSEAPCQTHHPFPCLNRRSSALDGASTLPRLLFRISSGARPRGRPLLDPAEAWRSAVGRGVARPRVGWAGIG